MTSVDGRIHEAGDADVGFTIMSVAKPFTFALVCDEVGAEEVRRQVGVNATGLAFNALEAIDRDERGRTNPMVNPGAIATTGLAPGETSEEKWGFVRDGLSRFAGRPLSIDDEVYESAAATNERNREIARVLSERGAIAGDPSEAVDVYTRQSCSASPPATWP